MINYKRICVNHGIKAICILDNFLVCASVGNTIKIINLINTEILLDCIVSTSSNIYGLIYKKGFNNSGILIAHGVHKIYFYELNICSNKCILKLLSKYCSNKWILKAKFLQCNEDDSKLYCKKNESNKLINEENVVVICLSNGSIILLDIYKGVSFYKYKFKGIHLLYSSDVYINEKKNFYKVLVAGGTPFNKILLWDFKINKKVKYWKKKKKKKIVLLENIQELNGHRGIIFKVKFFKKSKYICSVSDDREGRIWYRKRKEKEEKSMFKSNNNNIKNKFFNYRCIKVLSGHNARIWDIDICIFNEKFYFITCSEDSTCNVYEKNYKKYFKICNYNGNTVRCICFDSNLGIIISGSDNGTIYIRPIPSNIFENMHKKKEANFVSLSKSINNSILNKKEKKKIGIISEDSIENNKIFNCDYYYVDKNSVSSTCEGNVVKDIFKSNTDSFENNMNNKLENDNENFENNICDEVCAKNIVKTNDSVSFMFDYLNEKMKKNNDWIRSINHINLYDIIICTNLGCIYILKTEKSIIKLSLIYEEKKENHLLTSITYYGLNYICLGFSNGFCCFIFLKNENILNGSVKCDEKNKTTKYFKCFSHRISEMCLIPLSTKSYDNLIFSTECESIEDILYAFIKKEEIKKVNSSENIYTDNDIYNHSNFYQVVYNHDKKNMDNDSQNYLSNKNEFSISNFLLCNLDHTGNVKLFSIKNINSKIEINNILETEIDVKNKKSKIISMNYVMRQKKKKMGILIFIGDEYGCIFIVYIKIPIQLKSDNILYDFQNIHIKSKDKIRVHNNRKVFDIKIIDHFIYSCGKSGNIIKYQLFKDKNNIYTLYKLCLIKISYYSSIYKLLPMFIKSNSYEKEIRYIIKGNDNNKETKYNINNFSNIIKQNNDYSNDNEKLHDILICCFKEKKFVLYNLKDKIEYFSIDCGGFRRPLSIFMKSSENFTKTFSFCFCKEKIIYFYFKKLYNNHQCIPYQKIYINAGFHNKNVSFLIWLNKNYFCTCSEDGTLKIVHLEKIFENKKNKKCENNDIEGESKYISNDNNIIRNGFNKNNNYNIDYNNSKINNICSRKQLKKDIKNSRNELYYIFKKKPNYKKYKKEKKMNYLNYKMHIVQNIYNHSEPIFYICFLKNPFYYSNKLKILCSVGAKNSANIFYIFNDIYKTPILYHIEKLKVQKFSSNLRYLCVEGLYKILFSEPNKYLIQINIFIGTSIGYIFHYSGIYEFVIYENIVLSKIVEPANVICSYNLNSTVLSLNLKNIVLNNFENEENSNEKMKEMFSKKLQNNYLEKPRINVSKTIQKDYEKSSLFHENEFIEYNRDDNYTLQNDKNDDINHLLTYNDNNDQCKFRNNQNEIKDEIFVKRKIEKKLIQNILCCGLNNGMIKIYHYNLKLILMKEIQVHQNGINRICVKKGRNLIKIFSCGDDQSINILILEITIIENNIAFVIIQNTNFPNSHLSSIRSLNIFSDFLLSVSWDQYIYIWKLKKDKNKNIIIKKKKQIKISVYDVSCLNTFVIKKKKKKGIENTCIKEYPQIEEGSNNKNDSLKIKRRKYTYLKAYLCVSGSNGSIECFILKINK
ncbi:conserved Plasmodium protein, unknown function [Plasmodium gallinaceum]|uniref:Uncharacterized protein n=1 Tax=Plasmodium gallinaceum TaxID=5849 RepID=A0A1J1GKT9_PLAGA|nr:conserved Plasmodium protein, unknown function [Plasmodium gallinaceum]CRG93024.1 conserved Plasmodium protein, unknown function [Plasmodium gallinaceum]